MASCARGAWESRAANGSGGIVRGSRGGGANLVPSRRASVDPGSKQRESRRLVAELSTGKVQFSGMIGMSSATFCGVRSKAGNCSVQNDSFSWPQSSGSCIPSSRSADSSALTRRVLLSSVLLGSTALSNLQEEKPALALPSYREYIDRLDGYIFSYPSGWIQVRGAGADVFFRDPVNLDENLVVDFSSPSSSRYKSVKDLGTPEQAAQKVLKQKITEFMSTRLGVRRESKILSAKSRVGDDGRLYYDIEVDVKSYANTNQLAVMPADRVAKLEWSRRYLSTLGVENNRLYELRLQAPERVWEEEGMGLRQIMNSFQLVKLTA